ncbi:MAG TPA: hypothetical protein VER55_08360 [Ardenticatenaceae bacterium]|nr:hypothetical protein [Ardenticatenaceae bacterium]
MAIYQIRVKGHLDDDWSGWFGNLTIDNQANGEALLTGAIADQAALFGVLIRVRDLGLPLVGVQRLAVGQDDGDSGARDA